MNGETREQKWERLRRQKWYNLPPSPEQKDYARGMLRRAGKEADYNLDAMTRGEVAELLEDLHRDVV